MLLLEQLKGGDRRSVGRVPEVVKQVRNQSHYDELVTGLSHDDYLVVMRSADALDKLTREGNRSYLEPHKDMLLRRLESAREKELQWHLALIIPRLELDDQEAAAVWDRLTGWALQKNASRILRVNAIQGLFDITSCYPELKPDLETTLTELEQKPIPSVQARIRILRKKL